jgi:aspartate carbamoyltransferase catalytic subunit
MSSDRLLVSVSDLSDADIAWIERATAAYSGGAATPAAPSCVVGLLFMTSSLRTHLGFAVATARLGGTPIDVRELRWGPGMSMAETFEDTLRTMSGMVDVVVARTPFRLDRDVVERCCGSAFVNAGDADGEHPSQALIDLCAITAERGDVGGLRVGISGDLTSRCARSLVALLDRRLPLELALFAPPGRNDLGVAVGPELSERISWRKPGDVEDLDVLYLTGLAEGQGDTWVDAGTRAEYAVTRSVLDLLPADAVVLSPMPVVDEIAPDAWRDPRVRVFEQSDRGAHVRTALLARLLRDDRGGLT